MILDVEAARRNMVSQQLRTCGVLRDDVLQAIVNIPRQDFVPPVYYDLAFADTHIPLSSGQMMMTPLEEAQVLQALAIQPTDTVLEVGAGTGYMTALLATFAQRVYCLDSTTDVIANASEQLKAQDLHNVEWVNGNELQGLAAHAPFDVIVVNGSLPELTQTAGLRQQLTEDTGRLFVVVGKQAPMHGLLISRMVAQDWQQRMLFETQLPPLPGADVTEKFVF
ncbi:MAG: methyltransferase domain-containing protein [Legionellales bacterium]|nr:methyltransferase domain-containing protein [Legionellales bacterium]